MSNYLNNIPYCSKRSPYSRIDIASVFNLISAATCAFTGCFSCCDSARPVNFALTTDDIRVSVMLANSKCAARSGS